MPDKFTPQEIANIKAHAKYIADNPAQFEKDPESHARRMRDDLDYKNNQSRKRITNALMKQVAAQEAQGTQPNHHVTSGKNYSRTVGGMGGGNMPDEFLGQIK